MRYLGLLLLLGVVGAQGCDFVFTKQQAFNKGCASVSRGDVNEGMRLLLRASNAGMAEATFKIGMLYWQRPEFGKNIETAKMYFNRGLSQKSSEQVSAMCFGMLQVAKFESEPRYELVRDVVISGNVMAGIKSALPDADNAIRFTVARFCYEVCMRFVNDVEKSELYEYASTAKSIFDSFAWSSQPDVNAVRMLAILVESGLGYDYSHAGDHSSFPLWKIIAEGGDADACKKVGLSYAHGENVPKDSCEAVKWFSKSKIDSEGVAMLYARCLLDDHKNRNPAKALRIVEDTRRGVYGLELKAKIQAVTPLGKAGRIQDVDLLMLRNLCKELGRCYIEADGVVSDKSKAAELLSVASTLGDFWSTMRLANMYQTGEGVEKNVVRAQLIASEAISYASTAIEKERAEKLKEILLDEWNKTMEDERLLKENERRLKKRGTPEEVAERTLYVSNRVCAINFSLSKYVFFHPYLRSKISEAKVVEKWWEELEAKKTDGDWIGFLEAIRKNFNPVLWDENYESVRDELDYIPPAKVIDRLIDELLGQDFTYIVTFEDKKLYNEVVEYSLWRYDYGVHQESFGVRDELVVGTNGVECIKFSRLRLTYSEPLPRIVAYKGFNSDLAIDNQYKGIARQTKADRAMGKITTEEAEDMEKKLRSRYLEEVLLCVQESQWPRKQIEKDSGVVNEKKRPLKSPSGINRRHINGLFHGIRRQGDEPARRVGEW